MCVSKGAEYIANLGIIHNFPLINIRKVPREVLKMEGINIRKVPREVLNIRKVPREVLKTEGSPSVFNTSLGTLSPRFSTPPSGPCEC